MELNSADKNQELQENYHQCYIDNSYITSKLILRVL